MKNGVDFIFEYSDLNLFQTRVQILTGEYAGIVLEFGGSGIMQDGKNNVFNFDYALYEVPSQFNGPKLRQNKEFNEFLAYLLVDVIASRNKDIKGHSKLMEAASAKGVKENTIKINPKYYSKVTVI
jgi:hypothetical protein